MTLISASMASREKTNYTYTGDYLYENKEHSRFSFISIKIEVHASGSLIFLLFNMRFHTGGFVATQGQEGDIYRPIFLFFFFYKI